LEGTGLAGLFPDNPQPIGSDPLILLPDQLTLPILGKQLVETALGPAEPGCFNLEDGTELGVTVKPLLVGGGQMGEADSGQEAQAALDGQTDHAAEKFLPLKG
jgi:hypothetical protein